ncbi:hypothetical protein Syun_006626 [Stephania yunnanensis]|uniref:Small ribosomal subunit protein mS29 n=1 Tax=Stephania yunnanensis TaxID=152371 RepID=A0AAP0PYP2_9MAGN
MKGVDSMAMPEGSTLYELIQTGITHTHASVGVLVRLRKELSLVKDIPVHIAIDQGMELEMFPTSEHLSFLELREFVQPSVDDDFASLKKELSGSLKAAVNEAHCAEENRLEQICLKRRDYFGLS